MAAAKTAKKKTIRTIPQARTPAPEQDPQVRARNFEEVSLGYALEQALVESERCLQCADEPCVRGCPVGIDIPSFIRKISEKHLQGAYDIITDTNLLPSVCGRVCPQENQCEGVCTVGESLEPVAIGRLERWVGDLANKEGWSNIPYIEPSGSIGSAGLVSSGPIDPEAGKCALEQIHAWRLQGEAGHVIRTSFRLRLPDASRAQPAARPLPTGGGKRARPAAPAPAARQGRRPARG